ncbi:MAG: response regulator [Pseudomonadota bacterium]
MFTPRLFLVEDDQQLLNLYKAMLEAETYHVVSATGFDNALKSIDTFDALDLAIVDFWLGNTNASGLLDRLRQRFPNTPIIVMSGGNDVTPIEFAHAVAEVSGALAFLQKPFKKDELLEKIRQILGAA